MDELFPKIVEESLKLNKNISSILLDVDHFKLFNDTYGHQTGDQLLKELAQIAQSHIRENDILVRYGGENFSSSCQTAPCIKPVKLPSRPLSLEMDMALGHKITASFGISTYSFSTIPSLQLKFWQN